MLLKRKSKRNQKVCNENNAYDRKLQIACLTTTSRYNRNKDHRNVYTEQISKITLCSNDDKRLPIYDKIQHIHSEQMFLQYAKMI